ncbi:helix-turn-helix transcriptional regulator [Mycolicibacterium wolinskyi]|uniref:ArsR family transcriptional regulator n=1 Tax=Mycolicibacterium wolinskyi TaxID=59750 RepID=A0A1X2FCC2_9MYCO|nr:helix-turn-helix transcriptional regulator [Mycolicibacterium wolinskyi]MCV7291246.1 helix-turn-helix transcriptional regulator [Mycolicibacterium goodii]ORX15639.1 ArsR family transcriptional regulator [Mycolicibacterium wolinskyi]
MPVTGSLTSRPALDDLIDVVKALGDPVRVDMLERIAAVEQMACTDLVDELNVSASTVSYHVKLLRTAGLIDVRKEGRNFFYTYRRETAAKLAEALLGLGR